MKVIVVFSNRTDTLFFSKVFQKVNLMCEIVSTPKRAKFSCSVSARINQQDKPFARRVIQQYGLNSFKGFII